MTSPENTNDDASLARLTIAVTNTNLPEDEAEQQALCESLETAVGTVPNETLSDATTDIQVMLGDTYTSVSPICPACDSALTLNGIHLREGANAYAVARCSADCGWTGDGVYKLVDLDRSVGDHYESEVLAGEIRPERQRYTDRDC
ncbi:hypothetical protein M0R89_22965 (plasmid) [Halorussus limi]|uniref:Uncharacterized protein n=1 Tax=Halorussus limi TaxID=2938695 RepID=A0A8U0I3P8_9EURY|nr:hypothetical protein [Halorussus limi]UPV77234.1 hypothetical protein M0R89_22965 [Halorussus limi]